MPPPENYSRKTRYVFVCASSVAFLRKPPVETFIWQTENSLFKLEYFPLAEPTPCAKEPLINLFLRVRIAAFTNETD